MRNSFLAKFIKHCLNVNYDSRTTAVKLLLDIEVSAQSALSVPQSRSNPVSPIVRNEKVHIT